MNSGWTESLTGSVAVLVNGAVGVLMIWGATGVDGSEKVLATGSVVGAGEETGMVFWGCPASSAVMVGVF